MPDPRRSTTPAALALAALATLAGCGREDVTHFRVAKAPAAPAAAPAAMQAMAGEVPPPPAPSGAPLRWTLPKGWKEAAGGAMRYATFTPPVPGKVDASVVVLPGPAGGELANVNRWRGQIGLPPLDEAGLAAARQVVKARAGPLKVYDFTNEAKPGSRLVAALAESGGSTWFVKITGDAAAVGAARPDFITSLSLTITCLSFLMVLVVACTLAQVRLGTLGAVNLYMRSWFYWMPLGGFSIPIFPGGALVGLLLMVNLIAAQGRRLELSWRKAGIWVVHAGLILLVVGEFVTGGFQVDARLAFEEGQTANHVEVPRELELAIVDVTDPAFDDVYGVSETALGRGGTVAIDGTPLSVEVKRYHRNAQLLRVPAGGAGVDRGVGVDLAIRPLPPVTVDDQVDLSVAVVEVKAGGQSLGTWLASNAIDAPQTFVSGGRTYAVSLRARREYLPYTLTLKDFKHDVYPGTTIPKNFSSLVRLNHPATGEDRDVLIYMNQPLRYGGKAFFQASFGKDDTLSILQVVENPGWLLPYLSTLLVTVGLLMHFGISLARGVRRAETIAASPGGVTT